MEFNRLGLAEQARDGRLRVFPKQPDRPAARHLNFPPGSISRILWYMDHHGNLVALVHQYEDARGRILGSGMPDPKIVVVGDTAYFLKGK